MLQNKTNFLIKLISHLAQSKKPVVYIAGKVTGLAVEQYEAKFRAAQLKLTEQGFHAINPCDFIDFEDHWLSIRKLQVILLAHATSAFFLKDWQLSPEAKRLHELAGQLHISTIEE